MLSSYIQFKVRDYEQAIFMLSKVFMDGHIIYVDTEQFSVRL